MPFSIVIARGQFVLEDAGGREITRAGLSFHGLQSLIAAGEDRGGDVSVSGAVLRFILVHMMPRDDATAYMAAVHASWNIKRFSTQALQAIQALVATGDMTSVVNYIKLTREASRPQKASF
jgi:hypothetical protein